MKLKIEYLAPDELVAYENNAKIHTAEQVEQIKRSIEQFGMNDPIAVWKDNVIIEGHGRLIACKELGLDKVPVMRLDGLTDEQRRAYMLVHNKLTMNTGFDIPTLELELEDISIDMTRYGFDDAELDSFFSDDEGEPKPIEPQKPRIVVECSDEAQLLSVREWLDEQSIAYTVL